MRNTITMSTLVILLCAAGFVASQLSPNDDTLHRDTVYRQINHAIEEISIGTAQVFRQVLDLGPQDVEGRIADLLPYKIKAEQHLTTLETLINHLVGREDGKNFNETECRKYFQEYKKNITEKVIDNMISIPHFVFNASLSAIAELSRASNEQKIQLNNLKVRANTCNITECDDISLSAEDIYTNFLPTILKARDSYVKMVNGSGVIEMMNERTNWDNNFNEGVEILRKVYECVHYTPHDKS